MAHSIREQLLAAITVAVSGEYDVPAPESERDMPITIVAEGEDEAASDAYGQTYVQLPVAVARAEVTTSTDKEIMRAQANDMLASLISLMFADETFGGLADSVEYTGGGIQTEVGKFCFAEAQFTVAFHFVRGDPYTIDLP